MGPWHGQCVCPGLSWGHAAAPPAQWEGASGDRRLAEQCRSRDSEVASELVRTACPHHLGRGRML